MPGMPSASRTWAERHLQLLERADQALDPAELGAEAADGVGDLLRVERVVDLPVRGHVLLELGRQVRPPATVVISPSRTPGSRAAESTNRVVASSRNGATNAATTMAMDLTPSGRAAHIPRRRLAQARGQ